MKCLFIGGSNDGEWVDVFPITPKLRMTKRFSMMDIPIVPTMEVSGEVQIELYEASEWATGPRSKRFVIYVFQGMTPEEQFLMLLKGYKSKQLQEKKNIDYWKGKAYGKS
uniref:Uncharacterized protein n=1 Tax=viral metagenome TaxID=1070528 RepID=A0A6M3XIF6_9ZZZZ